MFDPGRRAELTLYQSADQFIQIASEEARANGDVRSRKKFLMHSSHKHKTARIHFFPIDQDIILKKATVLALSPLQLTRLMLFIRQCHQTFANADDGLRVMCYRMKR